MLTRFIDAIRASKIELSEKQIMDAARFAVILHRENENQNLTRILGPDEFVQGHLEDVVQLLRSSFLGKNVMDVGSGSGVPGLLGAAIDLDDRVWHLVDSERSKAEYLIAAAAELGLKNVKVYAGRAEEVIRDISPDTVMARAVGTVDKISGWIWNCSTWNNLILFKSKSWNEEWETAKKTRFGKKLTVTHIEDYSSKNRTKFLITLSKRIFE